MIWKLNISNLENLNVINILYKITVHHSISTIVKNASEPLKNSFYSKNLTVMPLRTILDKLFASQLVNRIHPCEAVLEIKAGLGVP